MDEYARFLKTLIALTPCCISDLLRDLKIVEFFYVSGKITLGSFVKLDAYILDLLSYCFEDKNDE